jgi:hypothetical protein
MGNSSLPVADQRIQPVPVVPAGHKFRVEDETYVLLNSRPNAR